MFNGQDDEFHNVKFTNFDSLSLKRNPSSDMELANKKYVDDSTGDGNVLRFTQTVENYLEVSAANDTYNLTKYDKTQITGTTKFNYPNTGGYLLQNWVIKCIDKNKNGKTQNYIKSTKANSPTGYSGAESLPPKGNSFVYIETSSNCHGNNVFVSVERNDLIQILI